MTQSQPFSRNPIKTLLRNIVTLMVLAIGTLLQASSNAASLDILIDEISERCPALSNEAIRLGLTAYNNARAMGLDNKNILTIVDFTQPSNKKRLCSINLLASDVIYSGEVSHGRNSGTRFANSFSNIPNQNKSSVGLFLTGKTYYGSSGYSLKLYGLDKGLNDNATVRHVVMHGTPYVSERIAKARAAVGRSLGCFGINKQVAHEVIDQLSEGTLIFAYYPTQTLEQKSVFLNLAAWQKEQSSRI